MLKVLLLEGAKFDRIHSRLGSLFLLKLGQYCDLTVYGSDPKAVRKYIPEYFSEKLKLVPHRNRECVEDIYARCGKPDVILSHQFIGSRSLVPSNFETCKIPKAILLFDTYILPDHGGNRTKVPFVQKNEYNLVIRRGCASFYDEGIWKIPSVWLPFAVREESFYTDPESDYFEEREIGLTFVGTAIDSKNYLYTSFKKAIEVLQEHKLIDIQGVVGFEKYPEALRYYTLAMAYALGEFKGHPAKVFEIMGSGAGLITEPFSGRKRLFGSDDVCWFYDKPEQVVGLVQRLLAPNHQDEVKEVTQNALRAINERHLDKHRAVELINILKALAGGNKIPSIWE